MAVSFDLLHENPFPVRADFNAANRRFSEARVSWLRHQDNPRRMPWRMAQALAWEYREAYAALCRLLPQVEERE